MHLLFLDTETYSPESLSGGSGVGAYKYAEHPEAAVALTAYALDDAPVRVLGEPGDDPDEWGEYERFFEMLQDPGVLKVAHNASFDRVQLSAYVCGRGTGWFLHPAQWADTMHIAALSGLPRGLDALAAALGVEGKDSAGPALIRRFAVPQRATKKRAAGRIYGFQEPEKWAEYEHYCAQDVETLRDVWHALEADPYAVTPPEGVERDVEVASELVNDLGLPVDRSLVTDGIAAERRARTALYGQLQEVTGLENPASTAQLTAWLKESCDRLADLPDVRRKTLEALLDDSDGMPDRVVTALRLRVDLARTSGRKLHVLDRATGAHDRIRGCFQYAGAHTGRWAGRLAQPQNLPREQLPAGESVEGVQAAVRRGEQVPQTTVAALIRPAISQPPSTSILVCDYSSIEAIVLAWLAREQWVVDAYREQRDLYVETAARMSQAVGHEMTRQEGKVALLGCIARGTPVLTDCGEVPIEKVTARHRVFDGHTFVEHGGVIYKGQRRVIRYGGLEATPDHEVWAEIDGKSRKVRFGYAAARGARPVHPRPSGAAVWLGEDHPVGGQSLVQAPRRVRVRSLHGLRPRSLDQLQQPQAGGEQGLPVVLEPARSPEVGLQEAGSRDVSVHEPGESGLVSIRRPGHHLRLRVDRGSCGLGHGAYTSPGPRIGARPNRQRSRVRARKSAVGHSSGKLRESRMHTAGRISAGRMALLGKHRPEKAQRGALARGDYRAGRARGHREAQVLARYRKTAPVYDIANAGPHHRFVAAGVLVHNCGYGSGPTGLRTFAGPGPTDEQLRAQVDAWRAANPAITALWRRLEEEFKGGGPIIGAPQRDVRVLHLPSGRCLTYRGVHATLNRWGQPSAAFYDPGKKHDVETYGGRLAENLTQAVARDVLAAALVRLQGAGFKVVGHVHDEVIIEGPGSWVDADGMPTLEGGRAFAEVRRLMTEPNPWSTSLPLRAAGAVMARYGKPSDEQEEATELAASRA